jgi:hypothetical protein
VLEAGGEILEQAAVTELIVEDGFLVGVRVEKDGQMLDVRGRIVVDASGIDGAVRTRLPVDFGIETDPISDEDTLFVCLEFRDDLGEGLPTGLNFYPFHKAGQAERSWASDSREAMTMPGRSIASGARNTLATPAGSSSACKAGPPTGAHRTPW